MKIKYYLRGFGVGVIFATVVLMLAYALKDSSHKVSSASNGNASKYEKDTTRKTPEKDSDKNSETSKLEETVSKETTSKLETTSKEETTNIDTSEILTETFSSETIITNTEQTTEPISEDTREKVKFVVYSGMSSNEVADELEKLGVVDDGHEFNMFIYNNGYESKLRVGEYEFPKNASYQEVVDVIVRK